MELEVLNGATQEFFQRVQAGVGQYGAGQGCIDCSSRSGFRRQSKSDQQVDWGVQARRAASVSWSWTTKTRRC
jgi:hypothetical protein